MKKFNLNFSNEELQLMKQCLKNKEQCVLKYATNDGDIQIYLTTNPKIFPPNVEVKSAPKEVEQLFQMKGLFTIETTV